MRSTQSAEVLHEAVWKSVSSEVLKRICAKSIELYCRRRIFWKQIIHHGQDVSEDKLVMQQFAATLHISVRRGGDNSRIIVVAYRQLN